MFLADRPTFNPADLLFLFGPGHGEPVLPRQQAIHGQATKRMGKYARLVEVALEWLDVLTLKKNRGQLARQQYMVKLNLSTITEREPVTQAINLLQLQVAAHRLDKGQLIQLMVLRRADNLFGQAGVDKCLHGPVHPVVPKQIALAPGSLPPLCSHLRLVIDNRLARFELVPTFRIEAEPVNRTLVVDPLLGCRNQNSQPFEVFTTPDCIRGGRIRENNRRQMTLQRLP
ncbi:hypothetical protein D9M69_441690 [compost metagenome]